MRGPLHDTRALAVGSILNGGLAYVFFITATRALGPADAAPVALLWTYWSFAAAALTFPLQHWITRSVAAHGGEGDVRAALPRVVAAVLAVSVASGLIAWLAREPLFGRSDAVFPLLVSAVTVGSGFVGVVRGGLAARSQFGSLAMALAGENLCRVVLALGLILIGDPGAVGFGCCLAAGSLTGLLWPRALRFRGDAGGGESAGAFLGPAAVGQLVAQTVLVGGPVALAAAGGGPHEVTALFSALALFRAPYTLSIGLLGQVTGALTRVVTGRRDDAVRRVHLGIAAGTLAAVALAACIGGWAGQHLLPWISGSGVELSSGSATLAAVGSALALSNLVMAVLLMAHGQTIPIAVAWLAAVIAVGCVLVLVPADPLVRTCWAFAAAEAVALAGMAIGEWRISARRDAAAWRRGPTSR